MGFAVALTKHLMAGEWPPKGDEAKRTVGKLERSTHPDVTLVTPDVRAGRAMQIKVEDIRDLESIVPLTPIEAERRVVIIDQTERMNPSTANALLKMLEEPPAHCIFILIAHRRAALLPTVISRCTPLRLAPVPADELTAWLIQEHGIDPSQATLSSRWSEGRPGAALSLPLEEWEARLTGVNAIMTDFASQDFSGVFRSAESLMALGAEAQTPEETPLAAALRWLRIWLREMLVAMASPNAEHLQTWKPAAIASGWTMDFLCALGDELEALGQYSSRAIDAQLALEECLAKARAT